MLFFFNQSGSNLIRWYKAKREWMEFATYVTKNLELKARIQEPVVRSKMLCRHM